MSNFCDLVEERLTEGRNNGKYNFSELTEKGNVTNF
jgi:hypothetical protein